MDGANFPQPDCIHRARGLRPVAKFREYVPTVEEKMIIKIKKTCLIYKSILPLQRQTNKKSYEDLESKRDD